MSKFLYKILHESNPVVDSENNDIKVGDLEVKKPGKEKSSAIKPIKPDKVSAQKKTSNSTSKKNIRSHKPKSKSYGISKECVEFLKSKGLTGLNVLPQSFVTIDQIQINPEIKTKGKDAVWVAKFPVIFPNGKEGYKTAYTREFMKASQAVKYKKISKIKEKDIVSLEEKTNKLLHNSNPVVSDAACVIGIILKTGLRVGSRDADGEDSTGNLGVRTLRKENIKIQGNKITLNFIGKSYQDNEAVFNSSEIANYLKDKLSAKKNKEDVFSCSYGQTNALMAKINPKGITPKDLRTYKATEFAKKLLQSKQLGAPPPVPDSPKEIKRLVKEKLNKVFTAVSQLLNNSPTMAKNSYVHPVVITSFLKSIGVKPEHVGYKHVTLENKNIIKESSDYPQFLSMDEMFEKYNEDGSEKMVNDLTLTEDLDSTIESILSNDGEYEDCEEYPIPEWFYNDNIILVKE